MPLTVEQAIKAAAYRHTIPEWFLKAIVARESYFDPNAYNPNGGYGLTQLTGIWYSGQLYPENLPAPNDYHAQYGYDMNFAEFGLWIRMSSVSSLTAPFDPTQNLDRFCTGYAKAAFALFKALYNLSDVHTWRVVAFHWNKGMYKPYDPLNKDYLELYDKYVLLYS